MATLITTIAQVKACTPLNKNMAWDSIAPYIQIAEYKYLRPILGLPQYNTLRDTVTPTTEQAKLIERCQWVVVYMAMWEGYPHLNVFLSDMGVQQSKSREDTSVPASQWAYQEARKKYADGGQVFSEELYIFLQANQADYPEWVSDGGYSMYNSLLIRNNKELGQYLSTDGSIRFYVALQPFLAEVQDQWIASIVGENPLSQMIEKLATNAVLTTIEADILKKMRRAMAWQAFFEAIPHLNVIVTGGSINIGIVQDGTTQHLRKEAEDRRQLLFTAENKAKAAWVLVREAWAIISPPPATTTDICPIDNCSSTSFWT